MGKECGARKGTGLPLEGENIEGDRTFERDCAMACLHVLSCHSYGPSSPKKSATNTSPKRKATQHPSSTSSH